MSYQPGTHLIATLHTSDPHLLKQYQLFQQLVNKLIQENGLHKLGEVYHDFSPEGFTGVVCLSESHLSVHTWPEYGKINVDVYLSNYLRNNDGTVQRMYEAIKTFFKAEVVSEEALKR